MRDLSDPAEAYAEARRVLDTLPASETGDFSRWVESGEIHLPQQLLLEFDLRPNTAFPIVAGLPPVVQSSIKQLLADSGHEPWGRVSGEYLILRMEHSKGSGRGKLLVLLDSVFTDALEMLYPGASLTPAENRVLMQIVAGGSVKSAAQDDEVSAETKRSQLKAAMTKVGVSGQKDLSNALVAQLVLQLSVDNQQHLAERENTDKWFSSYIDDYFPPQTRYHVSKSKGGQSYRCIDCGDPNGEVLIYLHQLGAPHCSAGVIEQANRSGVRLIIPLRNGAVAPLDKELSTADHLQHSNACISYAMQIGGVQKANIMAGTTGSAYAVHFIAKNPKHVKQLILTAASYRSDKTNLSLDACLRSAYRLAISNRLLFKSMVAYMRKSFAKQDNLKRFFQHIHRGSSSDLDMLDEIFRDPRAAEAYQYRIVHSAPSLLQDLFHLAKPDWKPLSKVNLPVYFIHGDEDSFNRLEDIAELAEQLPNAMLHRVDGAGTWLLDRDTAGLFRLIRSLIDSAGLSVNRIASNDAS